MGDTRGASLTEFAQAWSRVKGEGSSAACQWSACNMTRRKVDRARKRAQCTVVWPQCVKTELIENGASSRSPFVRSFGAVLSARTGVRDVRDALRCGRVRKDHRDQDTNEAESLRPC